MFEFTANHIIQLLDKHQSELQRFLARRVGNTETIEDILQLLFERLLGYRSEQKIEKPRAFLFRVAANLASDHLRSQERRAEIGFEDEQIESLTANSPSLEAILISQQQLDLLKQAVMEMPPRRREIFMLCKFEHCTYLEVAQRLGVSEGCVTKHMIKALEHCKQKVYGARDDS